MALLPLKKSYFASARVDFYAVTEDFSQPPRTVVEVGRAGELQDGTDPRILLLPLSAARHCSNAQDMPGHPAAFLSILSSLAAELLQDEASARDFKLTESTAARGVMRAPPENGSEEAVAAQAIIRGLPWIWQAPPPTRRDRQVEINLVGNKTAHLWATIKAPRRGPVMFGGLAILALVEHLARSLSFNEVVAPSLAATWHVAEKLGPSGRCSLEELADVENEALEIVRSTAAVKEVRDRIGSPCSPSRQPSGTTHAPKSESDLALRLLGWRHRIREGEDLGRIADEVVSATSDTEQPGRGAQRALNSAAAAVLGRETAENLDDDPRVAKAVQSVAEVGFGVRMFEDSREGWNLAPIWKATEAARATLVANAPEGSDPLIFWDCAPLACQDLALADAGRRALPEPDARLGLGAGLCQLAARVAADRAFLNLGRERNVSGNPQAQLAQAYEYVGVSRERIARAFDYGYFLRCCESIAEDPSHRREDDGPTPNPRPEQALDPVQEGLSEATQQRLESSIAVGVYQLGSYEARLLIDAKPEWPAFQYFLAVLEPGATDPVLLVTTEKNRDSGEVRSHLFMNGRTADIGSVTGLEDVSAFGSRTLELAQELLKISQAPVELTRSQEGHLGRPQAPGASAPIGSPQVSGGSLAAKYRLGPFEAHLHTDLETSLGDIAYLYILAVYDGNGEPRLFVGAERGPHGSAILGVFDENGHGSYEWNPAWEALEPFTQHALELSAKRLSVSEAPEPITEETKRSD